jgi:hypothetical protein
MKGDATDRFFGRSYPDCGVGGRFIEIGGNPRGDYLVFGMDTGGGIDWIVLGMRQNTFSQN